MTDSITKTSNNHDALLHTMQPCFKLHPYSMAACAATLEQVGCECLAQGQVFNKLWERGALVPTHTHPTLVPTTSLRINAFTRDQLKFSL